MGVYLHAKFEVSSMILIGFRQGVILPPPPSPSKQTPKKPTQIRVKSTEKILKMQYLSKLFHIQIKFISKIFGNYLAVLKRSVKVWRALFLEQRTIGPV